MQVQRAAFSTRAGGVTSTLGSLARTTGSNIILLGQDIVGAGVGGGDSGSAVFRITGVNTVELSGILWGGSSGGTSFVYSPLANVQRGDSELGDLITH